MAVMVVTPVVMMSLVLTMTMVMIGMIMMMIIMLVMVNALGRPAAARVFAEQQ